MCIAAKVSGCSAPRIRRLVANTSSWYSSKLFSCLLNIPIIRRSIAALGVVFALHLLFPTPAKAYLDPGTTRADLATTNRSVARPQVDREGTWNVGDVDNGAGGRR